MAENPDFAPRRFFQYDCQRTLRIPESLPGRITYMQVNGDLGTQSDLRYSRRHIREFFVRPMKKLLIWYMAVAHSS